MIARIWRGVVRVEDAERYLAYLHQTGVVDYQATPGNLGVSILHRPVEPGVEFTTLTFWDAMESIVAFAGPDPSIARYYDADDRFLLWREPDVEHFNVPFSTMARSSAKTSL